MTPSDVDEQPPNRPPQPRPQPPRRRPPARSRAGTTRTITGARRAGPPAPPRRRPPVEPDEGEGGGPPSPSPRSQAKLVVALSVATVLVISLAGFGFALSSRTNDAGPPPAPDDTPVPVTTFRDAQTGFTVEYPRSWRRVEVPMAEYRLALDGGNNVAFTIRVVPIQQPATAANLANFKAVTDGLVASNSTVKLLKEQAISLNGMLGYYYFYTFTDGVVEAVHAHYFLFSGHKMNILVFQTLPDDFEAMATTFDRIAESFRSDPNVPSSAPTTAPAPSTSTTTP